jgi:hypothetical protein
MNLTRRGLRVCLLALFGVVAIVTALTTLTPSRATAAASVVVPVELALLVDTSGSVNPGEYQLQKNGYVHAFKDEEITTQIERLGGIVVIYIEWDRVNHQHIRFPWTHLRSRADCIAFANSIQGLQRLTGGGTMMAPALAFARDQFTSNQFDGLWKVIDVSGDGTCKNYRFYELGIMEDGDDDPAHYGAPWAETRSSLNGVVDVVNGIFIGPAGEALDFYNEHVPFGEGSFAMHVSSFPAFKDAVKDKILREISTTIPGAYD